MPAAPVTSAPIAEELAKKQREISVAEFFEKNKQLLGFDTLTRALLTAVKEAVDNSLDACEEASLLPDITVEIKELEKGQYSLAVEDNGPGIVKAQIPSVFARLLYGSRFHSIRQSRGQQGIGISAAVMYGQLTTGRPAKVLSRIAPDKPAIVMELLIDTKKNQAEVLHEANDLWKISEGVYKDHGTRIELTLKGRYLRGRQSVLDYLKSTAIVNPHARITLAEPDGTKTLFDRATTRTPSLAVEIKPHPQGIELGHLLKMARATESYKVTAFLENEFSRVSARSAREICAAAMMDEDLRPQDMTLGQAERLLEAFRRVKLMAPQTDCLSPIGETLIKKGLRKEKTTADFIVTATRPPSVYSGNPFQVECGIIYGGDLPPDQPVQLLRFANRVPLLFQQGACAVTHAVEEMDWRQYGLEQKGGKGIPSGPAVFLVHMASTKVPFTSESKEAVADIEEITGEVTLALRECARKMRAHIRKKARYAKMKEKEEIIRKILPLISSKSAHILGRQVLPIEPVVAKIMNTVLIKDEAVFEKAKGLTTVRVTVTNFTQNRKGFTLLLPLPSDAKAARTEPEARAEGGFLVWDVRPIPTSESRTFTAVLSGLEDGDYEPGEIYVKGIDPEIVSGAEPFSEEAYSERHGGGEEDDGEAAEEAPKEEPLEEEADRKYGGSD